MISKCNNRFINLNLRLSAFINLNLRLSAVINRNVTSQAILHKTIEDNAFEGEVKPFNKLPGPSRWQILRGILPGGRYNDKSIVDISTDLRNTHGDIFIFPGSFGKRDLVYTFNPKDFEKVFRTETTQPKRQGFDSLVYYRKNVRANIFKDSGGLVSEQGEDWWKFRTTVNPVMANPKSAVLYTPKINRIADQFIHHIKQIRDAQTNEVPDNFVENINHWALDITCLIALDKDLGMISSNGKNTHGSKLITALKDVLEYVFLLDILPSMYKTIPTPTFKRLVKTLDDITEITGYYIDETLNRLDQDKKNGVPPKPEHEQSVLQRLVAIDRAIAVVMSMDLLMAGVDTASNTMSAILLCLATNPEKQAKLRDEIKQILPQKNSAMETEKLSNLPYLRACIKEGMRVIPVLAGNFRTTGQDLVLSGYHIPKGTDISMPSFQLLQDAKYFQRPKEYLPERWLRTAESKDASGCPLNAKEPFVFLPFGFGPRNCIGKRFVDLELEITIAKLIRNFEIRFDHNAENLFKIRFSNTPQRPLKLKFVELEN